MQLTKELPKLSRDDVAHESTDSDSEDEDSVKARHAAKAQKNRRHARRAAPTSTAAKSTVAGTPKEGGVGKEEEQPESEEAAAEEKLLFRKCLMQFSTVERREASFPEVCSLPLCFFFSGYCCRGGGVQAGAVHLQAEGRVCHPDPLPLF